MKKIEAMKKRLKDFKEKIKKHDVSNLFINEVVLTGTDKSFTLIEPMARFVDDDVLEYHEVINKAEGGTIEPVVDQQRRVYTYDSLWHNGHFTMTTLDGKFIPEGKFCDYDLFGVPYRINDDRSNVEIVNGIEAYAVLEQCLPAEEVVKILKKDKITSAQIDTLVSYVTANREQYGFQKKLTKPVQKND